MVLIRPGAIPLLVGRLGAAGRVRRCRRLSRTGRRPADLSGALHERADVLLAPDVRPDGDAADLAGHLLDRIGVDVGEDQRPRPLGRKTRGHGPADAAAGSRDDDIAVGQLHAEHPI